MELKNKTDQFVATFCQLLVAQMRNRGRGDFDRTGIWFVEQTKNVEERAFAAAGRADHRVQTSGFEIERNAAQGVDPLFFFTEIAFEVAASERERAFNKMDWRKVYIGCILSS